MITKAEARAAIQAVLGKFDTRGPGSVEDRAAHLVIQALEIARRRLDNPAALKLVYFEMGEKGQLPGAAAAILESYVKKKINKRQAKARFAKLIKEYQAAFARAGITPQRSNVLFGKA